jgi:hypothetical protein
MGKIRVGGEWAQVSELVERRTPRKPALCEVEGAKPGRHVPVSPDEGIRGFMELPGFGALPSLLLSRDHL